MELDKILKTSILDIVFDNRNKAYGAYELRKLYQRRLGISLAISMSLVALILLIFFITKESEKIDIKQNTNTGMELREIEELPEEEVIIEEKKPLEQPPPPEIKFPPFVPAPDEQVPDPPEPPPPASDAVSGDKNTPPDPEYIPSEEPLPVSVEAPPAPPKPTEPVENPAKQAEFAGDWSKYLIKYLNASVPGDNDAPPGTYPALIRFVVDVDGSISNVTAITSWGYGIEEEAIRVILKSPKWKPAMDALGNNVKAYKVQPITFVVSED